LRDLKEDLKWLHECQSNRDLSDEFLIENNRGVGRAEYQNYAPELQYGITFVESDIAREWLQRAIDAEAKLQIVEIIFGKDTK
jgi:hypothetical protein